MSFTPVYIPVGVSAFRPESVQGRFKRSVKLLKSAGTPGTPADIFGFKVCRCTPDADFCRGGEQ